MNELEKALANVNKKHGKGTVFKLSDGISLDIERIPTGSLKLDRELNGGVPKGRMTELYGDFSSGKTSLATHIVAEAQKLNIPCLLVDAEATLDPVYATAIGVDMDHVYISQPETLESAFDATEEFAKGGALVIFDSTNALAVAAELEESAGAVMVGTAARMFSQFCRRVNPMLKKNGGTIVFISQMRDKIGAFGFSQDSQKQIGVGNAVKFFASLRLETIRIGTNKEQGEAVSNKTKVRIKKNKTGKPFGEVEFNIVYGKGIDKIDEILSLGVEEGIIEKAGTWYTYTNKESGEIWFKQQGGANSVDFLENNSEILEKLTIEVKNAIS